MGDGLVKRQLGPTPTAAASSVLPPVSLALVRRFGRRSQLARSSDQLRRLLVEIAEAMGFRYVALVTHSASFGEDGLYLHNYPEAWVRQFRARRYQQIDPVHQACGVTLIGFRWSMLSTLIKLSASQREVLRASRRAGLGLGFTVPLHLPGARRASCSFAVAPGTPLPSENLLAAQLVGQLAYDAARRLTLDRPVRPLRLSARQRECVALLATGLTDKAIAVRLQLSEETVTKYLNAARRRHGFHRRSQLIAAALLDGEIGIDPRDQR